jgi:hypothetical protein
MCNLCGWNSVVTLFAALFSFCTVGERLQTCVKRASITASPHTSFAQHTFVTDCLKGGYNMFRNIYNTQKPRISYKKLVPTGAKEGWSENRTLETTNMRPASMYYAAHGHICQLRIHYPLSVHVQPTNQHSIACVHVRHEKVGDPSSVRGTES